MRLIYSILREINQSNTPKATDYKMKDYEFRKIIYYIKEHNYIKGEIITFTDILLGGAKVTEDGLDYLTNYKKYEDVYPTNEDLPYWVRQE
ncbi:hypothetical protein [Bacillus sp. SM2101]|uniref:hypothetical protein n=1 Tax=Bacillus sp. SM2101 TaxID=2805366 RepID=UPI001BDE4D71|nr:hypothetical protein [Bacillus sp. SM2101]